MLSRNFRDRYPSMAKSEESKIRATVLAALRNLLCRNFSGQFLIDHLFEHIQRLCAHNSKTVDKEGRGRADAEVDGEVAIRLHSLLIFMVAQTGLERPHVQPQVLRILNVGAISQ